MNLKKCSVKKKRAFYPLVIIILFFSLTPSLFSSIKSDYRTKSSIDQSRLLNLLRAVKSDPTHLKKIKKLAFIMSGSSVPILVRVIKSNEFPDKSRWASIFILGKIMGKDSAPLLIKYLEHPNFILRLASLKTLLQLKERNLRGKLKIVLK